MSEPEFVKTTKYRELEGKYFACLKEIEQLKEVIRDYGGNI